MKTFSLDLLPNTLGLTTRSITSVYLHRASLKECIAVPWVTRWDRSHSTRVQITVRCTPSSSGAVQVHLTPYWADFIWTTLQETKERKKERKRQKTKILIQAPFCLLSELREPHLITSLSSGNQIPLPRTQDYPPVLIHLPAFFSQYPRPAC